MLGVRRQRRETDAEGEGQDENGIPSMSPPPAPSLGLGLPAVERFAVELLGITADEEIVPDEHRNPHEPVVVNEVVGGLLFPQRVRAAIDP